MENYDLFSFFSMGSLDLINSLTKVEPAFFELSMGFSAGVPRGTFLWKGCLARASVRKMFMKRSCP